MEELKNICRRVEPLLAAYMDDELPAGERSRVEDHLSVCPGCGKELEEFRKIGSLMVQALEAKQGDPILDEIWPRVRAVMAGEALKTASLRGDVVTWHRRHMKQVWITAAVAASLLFVLMPGSINRPVETAAEIKIELEREDLTCILSMFEKSNTSIIWIFEENPGEAVR